MGQYRDTETDRLIPQLDGSEISGHCGAFGKQFKLPESRLEDIGFECEIRYQLVSAVFL